MYKLFTSPIGIEFILHVESNSFIPFDLSNTDYANFKKEILDDEAELQDVEGNTMTAAEAKAFVATLP